MRLRLISPLLSVVAVLGLFADQDGAFDRLTTHLGPIDSLFASGKSVVVGTGANVVASLAVRTGLVSARFVLPEGMLCGAVRSSSSQHLALTLALPPLPGETLTSVAAWNDAAVVLSRSNSHCVVRGWSERVLWEASLLAPAQPSGVPAYAVSPRQALAVAGNLAGAICGGSLFVIDAAGGKVLYEASGATFAAVAPSVDDTVSLIAALVDGPKGVEIRSFSARGSPAGRSFAGFGAGGAPAPLRPSSLQLVSDGACTTAVLTTAAGDALVVIPRAPDAPAACAAAPALPLSTPLAALFEGGGEGTSAAVGALSAAVFSAPGAGPSPFLSVALVGGGAVWVGLHGGRVTALSRVAPGESGTAAAALLDSRPVLFTALAAASSSAELSLAAYDATGAAVDAGLAAAQTFDAASHGGGLRALFALPFVKAEGRGQGVRLVAVADDGFAAMLQGGAAVWSDDGGAACVVQVRCTIWGREGRVRPTPSSVIPAGRWRRGRPRGERGRCGCICERCWG